MECGCVEGWSGDTMMCDCWDDFLNYISSIKYTDSSGLLIKNENG